jgi:hypothetical protein
MKVVLRGEIMNICIDLILLEGAMSIKKQPINIFQLKWLLKLKK